VLCREMGWTFEDLENTPVYRVEQAFAFLSEESKENERKKSKK